MTNKNTRVDRTDAEDGPGACFITDPQSGQQKCHFITKSECDQRGGVFFGGPCPPIDAVGDVKAISSAISPAKKVKADKTIKKPSARRRK